MRMHANDSALVIVDVQERLAPVMDDPRRVIYGCANLIRAALRLEVPLLISEQYPKGLGPTMVDLREIAPADAYVEKTSFSCCGEPAFMERFRAFGRGRAVIAGIEAHVCVTQTALEFKERGVEPFVVADCCSSRRPDDVARAFDRLRTAGVHVVGYEQVLFEWLGSKDNPAFKDIQRLVK